MIAVIPEMLKNAVLIQTENNGANKTHILAAKVRYGGERFVVGLVVNENNGKFFYDHELTEINALTDSAFEETNAGPNKASVLNVVRKSLLSSGFDANDAKNTRFSVREFDPTAGNERAKNVVAMLRPLVGRKRSGFDHAKLAAQIKKQHGVDVTPAEVAVWLNEAIRQNAGEMACSTAKIRNEWLYNNNALWKQAVDYAGSDDFKVRVSERMKDRNLEGTFWLTKKNEKSANTVIDLDALANEVARQTGRDAKRVDNIPTSVIKKRDSILLR